MFSRIGPLEIGIILVIILIIFGVGKLPQVGGAIGKGIREFKKAAKGELDEEQKEATKAQAQTPAQPSEKATKS